MKEKIPVNIMRHFLKPWKYTVKVNQDRLVFDGNCLFPGDEGKANIEVIIVLCTVAAATFLWLMFILFIRKLRKVRLCMLAFFSNSMRLVFLKRWGISKLTDMADERYLCSLFQEPDDTSLDLYAIVDHMDRKYDSCNGRISSAIILTSTFSDNWEVVTSYTV